MGGEKKKKGERGSEVLPVQLIHLGGKALRIS